MKLLICCILTLGVLSGGPYSEEDAKRYTWAAAYSNCEKLAEKQCGNAGKQIAELGIEPLVYKTVDPGTTNMINCVIMKDDA